VIFIPIKIFRHNHYPEDLNDRFKRSFNESDIIAVENASSQSSEGLKNFFNSLSSKGYFEHSVRSEISRDYYKKLITFITNSKKQIEVEKPPIVLDEIERIKSLRFDSLDYFCEGNLDKACYKRLEALKFSDELNKKRINSMSNQLENIQTTNENKNILALIEPIRGLPIYMELKKNGFNVVQELSHNNIIFDCDEQVGRNILFNKSYTKDSLARYFVCSSIFNYLNGDLDFSRKKAMEKSLEVTENLSYEDINSLSDYISKDILRKNMYVDATVVWLKKRGVKLADIESDRIPYIV